MRALRISGALLHLAALFLPLLHVTADGLPTVTQFKFDHQPSEPQYFQGSETVLILDRTAGVVYRSIDAGTTWKHVDDVTKGDVLELYMNPNNDQVAVALGVSQEHWITQDQGKSWSSFATDSTPALMGYPIAFHATDPNKIILNLREWTSGDSVYTIDGFKTVKKLKDKTAQCMWAKDKKEFASGTSNIDDDRTLCVVHGRYSSKQSAYRLLISDDFFEKEFEPELEENRSVTGIVNIVAVKGYICAARQTEGTNELALYVTRDTVSWSRAEFGQDHKLEEDGYTIMESRNYSLQVDVMTGHPDNPMGMLFSSNSNGTFFTRNEDYTNRDRRGFVDFENLDHVQGIALVNIVDNVEDVLERGRKKKIVSQITFNDGRNFTSLKTDKGDELHLHSVVEASNNGRIFSTPAPGIVMGIGNTGDYLKNYNDGDLYVSTDAGVNWRMALEGAHKYEIGDQGGVLLAVYDEAESNSVMYSTNHGRDWKSLKLGEESFKPQILTTVPDSTGLKFILLATAGRGSSISHLVFTIDFGTMNKAKCTKHDFETWHVAPLEDGTPSCVMGQTQSFKRRKAKADCFVMEEFHVSEPDFDNTDCRCSDSDFECDFGFHRANETCVPTGRIIAPEGVCKKSKDTFEGSSGYRLIPGNQCRRRKGAQKDDTIERPCGDSAKAPVTGKVSSEVTVFPSGSFREYVYLERAQSSSGTDETVVMLSDERELWITHDHGKTWARALEDEEILAIYPNPYRNDEVYFLGPSKDVFYSKDRGVNMHSFQAPGRPNNAGIQAMQFHPTNSDWLLWTSCADFGKRCEPVAHATKKGGLSWEPMLKGVEECQFAWREGRNTSEQLVYCIQHKNEDMTAAKQLVSSENWFENKVTHFDDMIRFVTMSEFIIAAVKDKDQNLKVDSSIDGKIFADARFPSNFKVPHQTAYTVMDSSTHSVFLHVTVNDVREQEYGSIIKSNSNGTSYVLSLNSVNRNLAGYVDFEKMQGLEGVATVNIVANVDKVMEGSAKILKSMITHNDGADWDYIPPPAEDVDGKSFDCGGKRLQDCSLHLHSYTERRSATESLSSPSAVGVMMAVGNVGDQLGRYRDGDTFVSNDGGIVWRQAKKGQYMWEFGDQGTIIVIVEKATPTNVVFFSRDEGETWQEYEFDSKKILVDDITTVPSDTSRNFMLWGRETNTRARSVTVNIDFTGLTDKKCVLDEASPGSDASDYYLWEPKHPKQDDNCLFGHVAQYHRKKIDRNCYNGQLIERLHSIARNCTCTRRDFECDYNYERESEGSCRLVPGAAQPDAQEICRTDPNAFEYYDVTGYRRIPLTTCSGGLEYDLTSASHPCPGKEEEYEKKRGVSGVGLFFAIVMPILVFLGVVYLVWTKYQDRLRGSIRLGDAAPSFSTESNWVQYPIIALSAVAAVVMAIPSVVAGLFRTVTGRFGRGRGDAGARTYTSRNSFARGRGGYSSVAADSADENDLLGEDSDEEV